MENENPTGDWKVFDRFDGDVVGAAPAPQSLLITVKDPGAVVRNQGAIATGLQTFLPATMQSTVYTTMQGTIADALKAQGVDATVSVVSPTQYKTTFPINLVRGAACVAGGAAAIGLVWFLVSRR